LGWVGRPLWEDIQALRAQNAVINATLSTLNEKKQYQNELIEKYNSITEEQLDRLLNQHLPKKSDTGTLLVALERMTRVSDARLNNIDFKKTEQTRTAPLIASKAQSASQKTEETYQELLFSFTVSASYENFKALLRAFEKNIRLIDVQSINFGGSAKNIYTFTVSAKTYFRK
jgi:Tfp pilus assembly protein PilO